MARRKRTMARTTAHRRFTTLQRDPTGKAKRKYARSQPDPLDGAAINGILDLFGVEANGVKLVEWKDGSRRFLRFDRRLRANGLCAFLIDRYERLRRQGKPYAEAYRSVTDPEWVSEVVDSGEVGRWCEAKSRPTTVKVNPAKRIVSALRRDGPRKAQEKADKARFKAIGDAYRASCKGKPVQTAEGITKGRAMVDAAEALRKLGVNPDTL